MAGTIASQASIGLCDPPVMAAAIANTPNIASRVFTAISSGLSLRSRRRSIVSR
jgi:hypothetical protein